MKKFVPFVLGLVFLVSCTKSGSLSGGSAQSGSYSGSVNGSVSGGLSPISGALVSLYAAGNATPLANATTTSTGAFTIAYNNPGSGTLYLLVTGGSAGSGGANSKLQLAALLGAASNAPASIIMNEATTAAFLDAAANYGMVTDTNQTVTIAAANNQATMTNMVKQYGNFIANGNLNSNLSSTNQSILATAANAIASCVENGSNCAALFNNAATTNSGASMSILDALYNMMNGLPNITNLYTQATQTANSTGIGIPGQPSLLNVLPIVTTNTFSSGGASPNGPAIDASGNAWVCNHNSNNVTELNSSGTSLGTFSVGSGPYGRAIDAAGNVWVANYLGNNVTKLNSSGTTLGTFSVGTNPYGIAIDAAGNVWTANNAGNSSSNNVTQLAGAAPGPEFFPYSGPIWPGSL